ncbi:MRC1-like domain-containing protein [Cubamyces menziesii]|nr:MRC1-like domain-containing protein [Cubamyces menziesii]
MSRSPSPVIRRAHRTYGRRRDTSDHDTSFDVANTSIDSHEDSYSSTSLALDIEVPPSSDDIDAWKSSPSGSHAAYADAPEDDDEDEPGQGTSKFHFAWKDKLKQIDAADDLAMDTAPAARVPHAELATGKASVPTRPASPMDGTVEDPFGGTLSSLTNSSRPSSIVVHNRAARRVEAAPPSELDSEPEVRPLTPQSSPRHTINTPQAQSSPTPPTSIEMPDKKGKGKQRAVNPLQFEASEELASGPQSSSVGQRKKRKASNAPKRVKAPTKKEQLEMKKTTARIVAEQPVSVPRMQQNAIRLGDLLKRFNQSNTRDETPPAQSDPIQTFSSPGARAEYDLKRASSSGSVNEEFQPNGLLGNGLQLSVESDDEFPDVSAFKQAQKGQELRRAALELKKRALEKAKPIAADDSDDDLIISNDPQTVVHEEERARRTMAMHGIHPSKARQRQLAMAAPRRVHAALPVNDEEETCRLLATAATSTFVASSSKHQPPIVINDPVMLNRILLHRNANVTQKIVKEKEEDWKRRGGRIKQQPGEAAASVAPAEMLKAFVEKQKAQGGSAEDAEMGDDDSDEDYRPGDDEAERRSQQSEGEDDENKVPGPSRGDPGDQADDEGEDENPFVAPRQRRSLASARHRPVAAVVSDDEEDVENGPPPLSASLARDSSLPHPAQPRQAEDAMDEDRSNLHRGSISSVGERTEDGTDKENDVRLSFDRSENKENTAIAVQSPSFSLRMSRGFGSLFVPSAQGSPAARSATDGVRSPLKELPADDEDEDDPFVLGPTPGPLRLSSPAPAAPDPTLEASPMNLGGGVGLEPAFSLSNKGKERARFSSPELLAEPLPIGGGGGFSQFFTQEGGGDFEKLKAAQREDDISLTVDTGIRPALEVAPSLIKKADELFEKEQEMVVQEHQAALEEPKPQLFVDENGFLTQTRPQIRSPLNMMTPSQFTSLRLSSPATLLSSVRKPLAPLLSQAPDDDDDDEIDENLPRRRLRRRSESPTPAHNPSPAVTKPRNAFDVLGRRAPSPKLKPKQKLERSAFIEGEAEESDDDAAFGFGAKRKDDDEEDDGEDQDQVLAELVDDKEIDEKTLAEEAVLEKVREHQEEDDKALEKVHLDAIQGKFRVKRKDYGIGFEDSGSESDEEAGKIRRKGKKRRVQNDNIAALAQNEDTQAFAKEYTAAHEEDNDEFAHLNQDTMDLDTQEPESEEEREVVTAESLREQLREAARAEKEAQSFNPLDTSWVENDGDSEDEMDVEMRVREVAADAVTNATRGTASRLQEKTAVLGEGDRARLARWAKSENSSRTAGVVGRNTGGSAAVTGHAKAKGGSGSFKGARPSAASSSSTSGKSHAKLAKAPSVLSTVSSRRSKFAN